MTTKIEKNFTTLSGTASEMFDIKMSKKRRCYQKSSNSKEKLGTGLLRITSFDSSPHQDKKTPHYPSKVFSTIMVRSSKSIVMCVIWI